MQNIVAVLVSPRFKSFYWRTGMMVLAGLISFLSASIADFHFTPQVTIILGLILGEISKDLNDMLQGQTTGFVAQV